MLLHIIPVSPLCFDTYYKPLIRAAGTPTGSPSGPPPPVDSSINEVVQKSANNDSTGQNQGGKDQLNNDAGQTVMGEAGKEKTAKESMSDHNIANH